MSAISVHRLSAGYDGTAIISDISFDLDHQKLLAILGPSGSGKSTLLKTIAGFLAPMAGSITIDGREVATVASMVPPEKRNIGLVPQEGALFPHLDVSANIGFGIKKDPKRKQRVAELLDIIEMTEFAHARPQEISGGQQQRVALARALAPKPQLIVLDEPFTALDASLRAQIRADIRSILTLTMTTAIMVTHDQEEALATADKIAIMSSGQLLDFGDPYDLYNSPTSLQAAELLGIINVLPATLDSHDVAVTEFGPTELTHPVIDTKGRSGTLLLRPEAFAIDALSSANATIVESTFHGHDSVLTLQTDGGLTLHARVNSVENLTSKDRCHVSITRQGVFLPEKRTSD